MEQGYEKGFTIVELIIVIVVIGILSGIVILSYGSAQKGVINTQVSTDLNSVKVAMQTARANAGGYPASIPSSFSASGDVTVSYVSGDARGYCI